MSTDQTFVAQGGATPGAPETTSTPQGNGNGNGDGHGKGNDNGNGHGNGKGHNLIPGDAWMDVDPLAAASISAPPVEVAPGEAAHARLSVRNLRSDICSFALSVSGLEAGWYRLPNRVGPLAPGESEDVDFQVSLPRGYPPCSLLVAVEARPLPADVDMGGSRKARPGQFASGGARVPDVTGRRTPGRHDIQVVVGDGATVSARLDPVDTSGFRRARVSLFLRNRGNHSQQVTLEGVSPGEGLELHFRPDAPLLLPGHEVKVETRVRTRRHLLGAPKRRPFAVRVQGRGTPVMAEGSFTSHPLLPRWASKGLIIGLVLVLWAAVAVVGIKTLSSHLHKTAVQNSTLTQPKHTSSATKNAKSPTATSSPPTGSNGASPTSSSANKSSGSSSSSSSSSSSRPTVDVAGKVTGAKPGGVTVTLSPTSLVSTQVLGASGAPAGATLAADRHHVGSEAAHRHWKGIASVVSGRRLVLTSAVRPATSPARAGTSLPVLVRASHRVTPLPDGKVYGTEAAAAFFPGLTASVTPTLSTLSQPDGSFVFTGVPAPGTYLVSFTEPGYNTRKYVVQTSKGHSISLDTALSPGTGSLSGTITGPKGPLGGVSITVSDGSLTLTTVTPTTGADVGQWSVNGLNTPDNYSVTASDSGYGTQITTASLGASASLAGVDLKLEPGVGSISGTVRAATSSQPVGDVMVTAVDGSATATATTSTVSPIGTYLLPNLTIPGTWTLTVSGTGWITQTQKVKLTGNATVNASLTKSGANVIGVVSSAGAGLANVGVSLSNSSATFKSLSESAAPVGGFDFGQIPPGQYVLSATSFGYTAQSASVNVSAGETKSIKLTMPYVGQSSVKPGSITGSVVNQATGAPLATVPIDLDGVSTKQETNSSGVYLVSDVAPGLHEITALGASKGFESAGVQVNVAEGATVTAPIIALPGLGTLNGVVLSAATGLPIPSPTVKLLADGSELGTPTKYTSSSTGTYKITDIPAGNYVLAVSATGYDTSETSVSLSPGETLTDNIDLTQGPTYQVKTYEQTTGESLVPRATVCVVVSRTTGGALKTTIAKLSTHTGGPVDFSALITGDHYVATFELLTTAPITVADCTSSAHHVQASAPTDRFIASPDNTAIYPAVLSPPHGGVNVTLEFPYVDTTTGKVTDCPIEATTPPAPCPEVSSDTELPTVSVTGTTGYSAQSNGTPGTPETKTIDLDHSGSDVWTYPTSSAAFVSTQVTLQVTDAYGQFEAIKKAISLPTGSTTPTTLEELLTPVPIPVTGTISPKTGVTVTVSPSVLAATDTQIKSTANNLASTDDISAVEGTGGALTWSDPATGASSGLAQPGVYTLTLSASGEATRVQQVPIPLCAPAITHRPGKCTASFLMSITPLHPLITLVVTLSNVPGALTPPTVTLYKGATDVASQAVSSTTATFTSELTPSGSYTYKVAGPGIETYKFTTPLDLAAATTTTLRVSHEIVDAGWLTGTVEGVLVPKTSTEGQAGASEVLAGASVDATITGSCPGTATTHTTFGTRTTTNGTFVLVGSAGGLCPGATYTLSITAPGFGKATRKVTVTDPATTHAITVGNVILTAKPITQTVDVRHLSAGAVVTVTATSPLVVAPVSESAKATGTTTVTLTFSLYPTTYSFTISAPKYETTTIGPLSYRPGTTPPELSYSLASDVVRISGTVTVSTTGKKSTTPIGGLHLTLKSRTGSGFAPVTTVTAKTTLTHSNGSYYFQTVPEGEYTISPGETYSTFSTITFSTGTANKLTENFTVYAPPVDVSVGVKVSSSLIGANVNGATVMLTPSSTISGTTLSCGTHPLLEKGLGSTETATAIGSATSATASFTDLVPDAYAVTLSGGTSTDSVTTSSASHTLVVCPSSTSDPAATRTSPASPTFTFGMGEISATVTLHTAPSPPPSVTVTGTGGGKTLTTSCTPTTHEPIRTTTCTLHLLVDLTASYTVAFSAQGYKTTTVPTPVRLTTSDRSTTITTHAVITLMTVHLQVKLTAPSGAAMLQALKGAAVTLTRTTNSADTYTTTTTTSGSHTATFTNAIEPGTYRVSVTPQRLVGATLHTEGVFNVTSSILDATPPVLTVTVRTGKVHGTIKLGKAPASTTKVTVGVDSVTCSTGDVTPANAPLTYACVLPPGTYTLEFSAPGYTTKTVSEHVTATATITKTVTLPFTTGTVHGTITLSKAPTPTVRVKVEENSAICSTGTVTSAKTTLTYSCVLAPGTYTLEFSATGYTTQTVTEHVTATATITKTVTLPLTPVTGVKVSLSAPTGVPSSATDTATVKLTGTGHTYTKKTSSSGVATFSTAISVGTYAVSVTPNLTGATQETFASVDITSSDQTIPETLKAGSVSGTITLKPTPTSKVTVKVKVSTVTWTTVTFPKTTTTGSYTCHLPPGTYTLKFSATGYTSKTVSAVAVNATATTTTPVTLT